MSDSVRPHGLWPTRLLCPWDFPGKNTGVGCHFLLQGIFPTQGSNLCPLYLQADSLPLSHQGRQGWTAAAAKSLQLCLTLCDPIDSSPPGSTVPRVLQARTLEWAATTWINFESIMLSKRNQSPKTSYSEVPFISKAQNRQIYRDRE